jgi:hypothetical protein
MYLSVFGQRGLLSDLNLIILHGDVHIRHNHPDVNFSIASLSGTTSAIFAFMSKMFASCTAGDLSPQASLTIYTRLATCNTTHEDAKQSYHGSIAITHRVQGCSSYTPTGTDTADDKCVDPLELEPRVEVGREEGARVALGNHEFPLSRL